MAYSSDEGEIIDHDHGDLKATSLPRNSAAGNGVDRRDRNHSRHSSPDADSASRHSGHSRRSRSPPRGYKRSRVNYDRPRGKGRDYETRHPRGRYEDYDRPPSRGSYHDYDARERDRDRDRDHDRGYNRDRGYEDRDMYSDKRQRRRSPSPYRSRHSDRSRGGRFVPERRHSRGASIDPRYNEQNPRPNGHTSTKTSPDDDPSAFRAANPTQPGSNTSTELSVAFNPSSTNGQSLTSDRQPGKESAPEPEIDFEEPEVIDEDAEIERRRKRRAEILAKSSSATPLLLHAVGATDKTRAASPPSLHQGTSQLTESDTPQTPRTPGTPQLFSPRSPGTNDASSEGHMELTGETRLMNTHSNGTVDDEDGPSAADYDPTVDMKEDERRDELRHGHVVLHGESHAIETIEQKPADSAQPAKSTAEAANGNEDDEDDDFDMFAEDFDEEKFAVQPTVAAAPAAETAEVDQATGKGGILEGDDKDGYYKIRIGEVMCNRYQVQATLGKGMFSGVVRAMDITTKQIVAIKMMRNNDALRKGGFTEIAILEKLNKADPENRKHIVKFERSFEFKGHLCMAFENLSLNLREVLRKFGNNVGINLQATKTYAYQIFVSLAHMERCSIIHADLKPDNILVNENRSILKICDLGTAIDRSDAATAHTTVTPYLVSRFYRAPEVILGVPYDYSVDMWSIGCTLYELYTGKILFAGDSNNQMLKAIMEIRGRITQKLYKRGQLSGQHFDEKGQFISVERDKVLGKTTVRTLPIMKPTRDLRTRLTAASVGLNAAETRDLNHFADLLEACLTLNPDKRIKAADALKHPFFTARSGHHRR